MVPPDHDIAEHQKQIEENLRYWEAKPVLREIYRDFHRLLARYLSAVPGETVEIGSGIGNIKEVVPECVRTDIFPNPWIDRQENIYRLGMRDGSVSNLILFDVFHHLEYPLDALDECSRVLHPGGRLLVFDHAMSFAGAVFSKLVHHERAGFLRDYKLRAASERGHQPSRYYADHANVWRIFERRFDELLRPAWEKVAVVKLPAVRWLLSGGYRGRCLVTKTTAPLVMFADRIASVVPGVFALRSLVVLGKSRIPTPRS